MQHPISLPKPIEHRGFKQAGVNVGNVLESYIKEVLIISFDVPNKVTPNSNARVRDFPCGPKAAARIRHGPCRPIWPGAHEYVLNENPSRWRKGRFRPRPHRPGSRWPKKSPGILPGLWGLGRPNTPSKTGAEQRLDAARGRTRRSGRSCGLPAIQPRRLLARHSHLRRSKSPLPKSAMRSGMPQRQPECLST